MRSHFQRYAMAIKVGQEAILKSADICLPSISLKRLSCVPMCRRTKNVYAAESSSRDMVTSKYSKASATLFILPLSTPTLWQTLRFGVPYDGLKALITQCKKVMFNSYAWFTLPGKKEMWLQMTEQVTKGEGSPPSVNPEKKQRFTSTPFYKGLQQRFYYSRHRR